jgi:DNA ligase-1
MRMFEEMYRQGIRDQASVQEVLGWLYASLSPEDANYVTRFLLGKTRIGVQAPTFADAVSIHYGVDPTLVSDAYSHRASFVSIIRSLEAKEPLEKGLAVGSPFAVMLASRANTAEDALALIKEWLLNGS